MTPILFTNVFIFDGSGAAPFLGEVQVSGNRICAVTEGIQQIDRSNSSIIDGGGMTLMPGMVEAHAHLSWPSSVERVINTMKLPAEEHLLITAQNARITLDHGFTSAYSAGSLGERFEVALRDMIDGGYLPGPRLRASSLEKGFEGVLGVPAAHNKAADREVAELRDYVRAMAKQRMDSIKFVLNDAFAPKVPVIYSEDAVQAIGREAKEVGIWLTCHAQTAGAIKQGLRAGFRTFNHCTYADDEALDLLEAESNRVFVAPAAGLLYARAYEAEEFSIGEDLAAASLADLEIFAQLIPEMKKRGIRVLPGGDYGFPYNPVGRNARDLQLFVDHFGYSPTEVLVAATASGGELMDMTVGQIRAGFFADMLLIDGDPTVDVRILQQKARIMIVMKDGVFHRLSSRDQHEFPKCLVSTFD